MSIKLGSSDDSFEKLQTLCNDKSNELLKTIELETGEEMIVVFWTTDFFGSVTNCMGNFLKDSKKTPNFEA